MNSNLAYEVGLIQNKALGAYLMHLTVAECERHQDSVQGCPIHLLFLVLPILYQKDISAVLKSTRVTSGIRKFVNKFSSLDNKQADVLLRVHDTARIYKQLSWDSFVLGVKSNMFAINANDALVRSRYKVVAKEYEGLATSSMIKGAGRLGVWFAKNSLYEVASNLRVRF